MKKILASVAAVAMMVLGACGVMATEPAMAINANTEYITATDSQNTTGSTLTDTIKIIINVIIGVVGLVAVVMIIVGGISFTTSQGDSGKVAKARNTVLYGIVGLVVAILAFAIVNFVLSSIFQ